jgi:hypothetical protein
MLEDFYHTGKIQRLRPGLNPRTGVPEASMLTTRPSKPLKKSSLIIILIYYLLQINVALVYVIARAGFILILSYKCTKTLLNT